MMDTTSFTRSAPEAQGIQSSAILQFVEAADREIRNLHSIMVLRHGVIVAEGYWDPYNVSEPHMLFSLSKSFTSTAIGMLVAEGKVSVEDLVLPYFEDVAPAEPSPNLQRMRVKHLLTMTTGHDVDPSPVVRSGGREWQRSFLARPVEHEPGTHFVYNSVATYMLSAIVQRVTGQRLVDFLGPRLFKPLGMGEPFWESSPEGINTGGWGLRARTVDIARFGQLYLQGGVWQGERLVDEAWVAEATSFRVPNAASGNVNPDWQQGYGYQFWRCRNGAYRGDGAFGQFCVVLPEQDAVVATTSGLQDMQAVLDLVWKHLLPGMQPQALPDDPATAQQLAERLAGLRIAPVAGAATSPRAKAVSGREFSVGENADGITAIRFDFTADGATLTIRNGSGEQRIACGYGWWIRGEVDIENAYLNRQGTPRFLPNAVAAGGAWTDDTFVADVWWSQTPFRRTLTCRFRGDGVQIDQQANVSMGSTERPRLTGRASVTARA